MNEKWEEIGRDYIIARECLWAPKKGNWIRNEDKGMFYLWKAYYAAKNESEKDDLIFARILIMMARENRNLSNYERYNKFLIPAQKANEKIVSSGKKGLSEKELEILNCDIKNIGYELKCTDGSQEELYDAMARIKGLRNDFCFHDGKVKKFEHMLDSALMIIQDGESDENVTLEFLGVESISISTDPVADWIFDFYCYPITEGSDLLVFDIGFYKIVCKEIRVVKNE